MFRRLRITKIGFERPVNNTVYHMLRHKRAKRNPERIGLLKKAKGRFKNDGLNTVKYKLIDIIKYKLFTLIKIDVGSKNETIYDD